MLRSAFVFLALMEFTVVNYLWRKELKLDCSKKKLIAIVNRGPPPPAGTGEKSPEEIDSPSTSPPSCNKMVEILDTKNIIYFEVGISQ